ncbi:hypothetical protein, partial [Microvirga arabica]|uniref:hypothetical protein n=1 Tax=Microvirga arabica TaxID=1128671 RepID=UPI001AED46BF
LSMRRTEPIRAGSYPPDTGTRSSAKGDVKQHGRLEAEDTALAHTILTLNHAPGTPEKEGIIPRRLLVRFRPRQALR